MNKTNVEEILRDQEFTCSVMNIEEPVCPKCSKGKIICTQGHIKKPHYFQCSNNCRWHMNIDYADEIIE